MTTFDKGFEHAEYQWTVEQLEYRLESICHLLEQNTVPLDQQLSNITKSLLSLEPATGLSSSYPIKLKQNLLHNIHHVHGMMVIVTG